MHSQTDPRRTDSVLSESMSLCVKRIGLSSSPLAISSSPESFVYRGKQISPALFVLAFMERYISASKLRWRKYVDRGEPADRYHHKGKRTVRGRFMDESARSQSIMPAAPPLHYGDTVHTYRTASIYQMCCHAEWELKVQVWEVLLAMLEVA
ncbi:hypothetical protein ATANTOWER_015595 [Ataeniobius toweri]|uniref:CCT domain-containing protein n=1 Tax=Ataeniobius toweri TaxID=208326 RepID=A0ABU7A755_9TELE|nr:hypothetical protein [Ataeniobius toweri]